MTDLLASTYIGGSGWDSASSIVVDSDGNVYVAGDTASADFPTSSNAYQDTSNGVEDAFISKLNNNLTSILASTYLGGSDSDGINSMFIDSLGNIYVTGYTYSSDFPTTSGAYQTAYGGGGDAFVAKFSGDLQTLLVSTFLGGSDEESALSIAMDSGGNIYIAGWTFSLDFPTTSGAYGTTYIGLIDVFISKLSNDSGGGRSSGGGGKKKGNCSTVHVQSFGLWLFILIPIVLRRLFGR